MVREERKDNTEREGRNVGECPLPTSPGDEGKSGADERGPPGRREGGRPSLPGADDRDAERASSSWCAATWPRTSPSAPPTAKTHEQQAREALLLERGLAKERLKAGAAQTNAQRWGTASPQATLPQATDGRTPQARDLAGQHVGKSRFWVERAAKVVDAIDTLVTEGNLAAAEEIRAVLSAASVQSAYDECVRLGHRWSTPATATGTLRVQGRTAHVARLPRCG
jgi:hypothetical protein